MRHCYDSWTSEGQQRFELLLPRLFYPIIQDFYPSANGNWHAAMIQTMLAMGVFLEVNAVFERHRDQLPHPPAGGCGSWSPISTRSGRSATAASPPRDERSASRWARMRRAAGSRWTPSVSVRRATGASLNAIAGYVDLVEMGIHGPLTPAQRLALSRVQKSQQHLRGLINEVLNYARLESGAVTYDSIQIACQAEGDAIEIRVSDTGIGIPADKLDFILEPFVQVGADLTRPSDEMGLGLAISRDLAPGMGGDLTVRSVQGKGSTFTVHLPRADL